MGAAGAPPPPRHSLALPDVTPSNREIVRLNSEAFSRRDAKAMLELYAPDAVVIDRRAVGWGEFRGHDALRSYYEGLFDNATALHEDLDVVSDEGDALVVGCRLRARLVGQEDAGDVSFEYALRVRLREGLIVAIDIYEDVATAVPAGH